MKPTKLTDSRCSERISINRTVEINNGSHPISIKMVNISNCGFGALASQVFQNGEILKVEFSLPGYEQNSKISLNAQVIHSTKVNNNFLIGLSFQDLTPHQKLVIKEFSNFHKRFDA
ncbi:PilZ domain-containing protein [Thiomicrorhabdus lithotrophica]|uniref:PilZ domain-containing protein n=1 Tax=Thiomicrorhabdus lithotrophica TaxID=2949997 RepID=A0ABY8CC71_9GAMM|nr:PilZ domain-containing protein [Thiomicrorhabdus lithotrophica]WEJ63087.1 PilZ domain-containing protein [Thiomicrorhabdus lithotrophica]